MLVAGRTLKSHASKFHYIFGIEDPTRGGHNGNVWFNNENYHPLFKIHCYFCKLMLV